MPRNDILIPASMWDDCKLEQIYIYRYFLLRNQNFFLVSFTSYFALRNLLTAVINLNVMLAEYFSECKIISPNIKPALNVFACHHSWVWVNVSLLRRSEQSYHSSVCDEIFRNALVFPHYICTTVNRVCLLWTWAKSASSPCGTC